MPNYSKEFLEKTVKIWQPHSPVSLSLKNAGEIVNNITDLFSLLLKWERKDGEEEKNLFEPNGTPLEMNELTTSRHTVAPKVKYTHKPRCNARILVINDSKVHFGIL